MHPSDAGVCTLRVLSASFGCKGLAYRQAKAEALPALRLARVKLAYRQAIQETEPALRLAGLSSPPIGGQTTAANLGNDVLLHVSHLGLYVRNSFAITKQLGRSGRALRVRGHKANRLLSSPRHHSHL